MQRQRHTSSVPSACLKTLLTDRILRSAGMPGSSLVLQHSSYSRVRSSPVHPAASFCLLRILYSLLTFFRVVASVPGGCGLSIG